MITLFVDDTCDSVQRFSGEVDRKVVTLLTEYCGFEAKQRKSRTRANPSVGSSCIMSFLWKNGLQLKLYTSRCGRNHMNHYEMQTT